ncbi:hypothetical protein [Mycoplasmopsis sturni]|uniref:hypothetical protein n=1 Tax=Mycoplasmopsis sturni TaxID=39047 RepID=UPI0012EB5670|nr:hypothetical protein [Mycoplasmopsis sturni]
MIIIYLLFYIRTTKFSSAWLLLENDKLILQPHNKSLFTKGEVLIQATINNQLLSFNGIIIQNETLEVVNKDLLNILKTNKLNIIQINFSQEEIRLFNYIFEGLFIK